VTELPTILLAANVFGVPYKTGDSPMELAQRLRITKRRQILSDKLSDESVSDLGRHHKQHDENDQRLWAFKIMVLCVLQYITGIKHR